MWLDLKGVWRMMHSPHVRKKNIPPR